MGQTESQTWGGKKPRRPGTHHQLARSIRVIAHAEKRSNDTKMMKGNLASSFSGGREMPDRAKAVSGILFCVRVCQITEGSKTFGTVS